MKRYILLIMLLLFSINFIFLSKVVAISLEILPPYTKVIWNENPEEEVVQGYRLYYGLTSGVYSGFVTIEGRENTFYLLADLPLKPGVTYYFVLTAYNGVGSSSYSNEVEYNKSINCEIGGDRILIIDN